MTKPQIEQKIEEIKNSHTMKLIPQSQRELFWSEIEPKLQALIQEAIEQYAHEDTPRIQKLITESNRELLERLVEEYGGNNFQMSDAVGHTHNIKAVPVRAIEAELTKLRGEES